MVIINNKYIIAKYKLEDIKKLINSFKDLKVLVVGELIIDEYNYGEQGSKVRNECLIEFLVHQKLRYMGGAGLVANNVAEFVNDVTLLTLIGDSESNIEFIKDNLNKNIKLITIEKENSITPIKIRYVEDNNKLHYYFKSSEMNDNPISGETTQKIIEQLLNINDYDIVIIIDKGHGMINETIADRLSDANCKSANTQFNMENKGYSTLQKYPFVDLITINELELRNLVRDNFKEVYEIVETLKDYIYYGQAIITLGKEGCIITDDDEIHKIMNANVNAVDPMGAGDALQTITTLSYYRKQDMELTGFLGNLAGSIVCKYPGTQKGLTKKELLDNLEEIWKR